MNETRQQFEQAYIDHRDRIYRFFMQKLAYDSDLCEDQTQEAFMKAWRAICRGTKVDNMRAFFYQIAANMIVDEYRRRKNQAQSLDEMQEETLYEPARDDDHIRIMDSIDGKKVIEKLYGIRSPYGEVLVMKYVEGLDTNAIAKIMNTTLNTASVRINRAEKILAEMGSELSPDKRVAKDMQE